MIRSNALQIQKTLRRARLWKAGYAAALFFLRLAAAACLIVGTLALLDFLKPLPRVARHILWWAGAAVSLAAGLWKNFSWRGWGLPDAALAAGKFLSPFDALQTAWSFASAPPDPLSGVSPVFVDRHIRRAASLLPGISLGAVLRPDNFAGWTRRAAVCAGFLALVAVWPPLRLHLGRVAWPHSGGREAAALKIAPGNIFVESGGSVTVDIDVPELAWEAPELFVRGENSGWEKRPLNFLGHPRYQAVLENITEPLHYRAAYHGERSAAFKITPYRRPSFTKLRIVSRPPAYTGLDARVFENALEIEAPRGSRLEADGELNRPVSKAELRFEDGRRVAVSLNDGQRLSWSFEAAAPGLFEIFLDAPGLPAGAGAPLSGYLHVDPDDPPVAALLSPSEDLEVSPDDRLPLAIEVSDDYGVSESALAYQVNDRPPETLPLKRWPGGTRHEVFDFEWFLAPLKLGPGDRVRFFISAADNNSLSGPGRAQSAALTLTVASFEREHADIEKGLEEFRKNLLDIVGEQSLLKSDVSSSGRDWPVWERKQLNIQNKLASEAEKLRSLNSRMSEDPLTDEAAQREYEGIARSLEDIAKNAMPQASASMRAQDHPKTQAEVSDIASELERLSLLSEDAGKSANMRRVLEKTEDLMDAAESLAGDASLSGGGISPEERERLNQMMEEMARLMREISDAIQKLPQDLPDDFVNQEGVKNLRWDEAQSLMNQLGRDIQSGNAASAMKNAQSLLSRLKEMRKALNEAGGKAGGNSWYDESLQRQMAGKKSEIEVLADRQQKLKDAAQALWKSLEPRMFEAQKALMSEWLRDIGELGNSAADAGAAAAGLLPAEAPSINELSGRISGRFAQAEEALRKHEAAGAAAPLNLAVEEWGSLAKILENAGSADARRLRALREKAAAARSKTAALLSALSGPPAPEAYTDDPARAAARGQEKDQSDLRKDVLSFRRELEALARETAVITTAMLRRLSLAAEAMAEASASLGKATLPPALLAQEKALQYLRDSQEDMENAMAGMPSIPGGGMPGGGVPRGAVRRSASRGGQSGASVGPVKLPKARDFKPPEEFREEVLKSMREKFPRSQEKAVQDYYERWLK